VSYLNCRQEGRHEECNGYIGPLDTYVCPCSCHDRENHDAAARLRGLTPSSEEEL
jgi:hypothetical protein